VGIAGDKQTDGAMPRRFNFALLFWTLAGVTVLFTVIHLIHSRQMQHNASAITREAEKAVELHDYSKAASLYQQYLTYYPEDTDAIAQYALALEKSSTTLQTRLKTFLLLEQVLRRQPDRVEARKQAVEAAMDLGRFDDAIRHLRNLLATAQPKASLEHKLGWCQEAVGNFEESAKSFRRAIADDPAQIESYVLLSELLTRRLKRLAEAAEVIDTMVAANPKSWKAYLARARFGFGNSKYDASAEDIKEAFQLAPEQVEVLLAAAELAFLTGNLADARLYVNRGLALTPKIERLYRSLANLEMRCGHLDEAISCLERGLKELPDSTALRVHLAEAFLDKGQPEKAGALRDWLNRKELAAGVLDYLDGRLLIAKQKWSAAQEKLNAALQKLGLESQWSSNLRMCMGTCHEHLGELDLQVSAYREAVILNPYNVPARLHLGKSFLSAGAPQEAASELLQLTLISEGPPEAWPFLARAKLDILQYKSPTPAELAEIDQILTSVSQFVPESTLLPALQADRLVLAGDTAQAESLLAKATADRPAEPQIRKSLAELQARLGHGSEALEGLIQAKQSLGPQSDLLRMEATLWIAKGKSEAVPQLAKIADEAKALPDESKLSLLRYIADALMTFGAADETEKVLRDLATLLPKDLTSRLMLFDLALNANRDADVLALIGELRRIEGENGYLWRAGDAAHAIQQATHGDRTQLEVARKRVAEVIQRKKDWARAALLKGYVEELDGDMHGAIEAYRRAIDLGERPPALVLRVGQWLYDKQRFLDAHEVLRQLEDVMPLPRDHAKLAAEVAVQNHDMLRAAAMAAKAVPANTRDYREQLWQAQMQWLAGLALEADDTLRSAVKTAPRIPDVWVALVHHLARTDQLLQLESALEEMRRNVQPDNLTLTVARCLEAAGRPVAAEEAFQAAVAENPTDVVTIRQAAEFYVHSDQFSKAESILGQLLTKSSMTPTDVMAWAKRELATLLAARNAPGDLERALELVPAYEPGAAPRIADDRVRAFVLANDPQQKVKALRLFEQTLDKQALTSDERLLLARIYDLNKDFAKARTQMLSLLAVYPDRPYYLAYYVARLIDRGSLYDAKIYFAALERLEPLSLRTQALRADLAKAEAGD
jgi:tetratricopeptide (TPR) repeat protein